MADAAETKVSRNPRQIAEAANRGPNRFEPTPEAIPGNPEPKGKDHRDHPIPSAELPTVPQK